MSIKKLFKFTAPAAALSLMPAIAQASNLKSDDFVGISFWLISMALVASTA
ncbi:MAG: biphenyl 2,3-dioxygenase, partial [Candidatus Puniceispirillaceae bacterium]